MQYTCGNRILFPAGINAGFDIGKGLMLSTVNSCFCSTLLTLLAINYCVLFQASRQCCFFAAKHVVFLSL